MNDIKGEVSDDQWLLVARHMNIHDLCWMMQLSKKHYYLFVADRTWRSQRNRICARFPGLGALFDEFAYKNDDAGKGDHKDRRAEKRNSAKKARTKAWSSPYRGIWYTFKHWLSKGCYFLGFRELLRKDKYELVYAVLRSHIPNDGERIERCERSVAERRGYFFCITFKLRSGRNDIVVSVPCVGRFMRIEIRPTIGVSWTQKTLYAWPMPIMPEIDGGSLADIICKGWEAFLFENHDFRPWWTEKFVSLVNE